MGVQIALKQRAMKNQWTIILILFGIAFLYNILFFQYFSSLLDEGSTYAWSIRMLQGDVPYKDFFTLITPASLWISSFVLSFTGNSYLALHVLTVIFASLYPMIVYYFTVRLTRKRLFGLLAFALSLFMGMALTRMQYTIYSNNAQICGVIGLLFLVLFLENPKKWMPYVSGAFVALGVLFKQSVGIYFMGAFIIVFIVMLMIKEKRAAAKKFIPGFLIVLFAAAAFFCIYYLAIGALDDMINVLLRFPLTVFGAAKISPPAISDLAHILNGVTIYSVYAWLFYIQVFILCLGAGYVIYNLIKQIRKKGEFDFTAILLLCFAAAGFLIVRERCSYIKVISTVPMNIILLTYVVFRMCQKGQQIRKGGLIVFAACVVAICLLFGYARFADFSTIKHTETEKFPATELYTTPENAAKYNELIRKIEEIAGEEEIFIFPMSPQLYYATGKQNVTRNDLIITGNFDDAYLDEMIDRLESKQIQFVVFDNYGDMDGVPFSEYATKLYDYITENYSPVWQGDERTVIMERK